MSNHLRALHIVTNLIWVGSTLAIAVVLKSDQGEPTVRGSIGRSVYKLLAGPASIASLLIGLALLGSDPKLYFKATHYMHLKLPLALAAVGFTHVIGGTARRMASGEAKGPGAAPSLAIAFGVVTAASALLASLKPF